METSAKKAAEEVLYNGVDLDSALRNAQRQMERRNESFKSLELAINKNSRSAPGHYMRQVSN